MHILIVEEIVINGAYVVVEEKKKMRKRSNVGVELYCHCFDILLFLLLSLMHNCQCLGTNVM